MCANGEVAIGCVIVGRRIEALLDERVNDAFGIEIVVVVVVVGVVAVGVVVGVVVGIVGVVVGIVGMVVGIVGMVVGIVGIIVGIVGIIVGMVVVIVGVDVKIGDGLPVGGEMPIDRRARPSSGSTEIDAFLLDLR
jgi:hypothetical protein